MNLEVTSVANLVLRGIQCRGGFQICQTEDLWNLPDQDSKDNTGQLQVPDLIQLRIALLAEHVHSSVANDHASSH